MDFQILPCLRISPHAQSIFKPSEPSCRISRCQDFQMSPPFVDSRSASCLYPNAIILFLRWMLVTDYVHSANRSGPVQFRTAMNRHCKTTLRDTPSIYHILYQRWCLSTETVIHTDTQARTYTETVTHTDTQARTYTETVTHTDTQARPQKQSYILIHRHVHRNSHTY